RWRRRRWLIALIALVAIAAIAGGVRWWIESSKWVSTDDAFIDTHTVQVSAQVAGRVKAVLAGDNQEARAGQPLVELDPADFQAALSQAMANQESAQGQLAQAKAQLPVAQANLDQARAQVAVAQAAATNADINLKRDQMLERMGGLAVSRQQLDNDTATARSDTANLAAAQKKVAASEAQLALNKTQVETAEAGVRAAAAQVAQARLNLSYTVIRASEAGHITNKTVALGNYIQVGQALMALVPDQVWVTANYKETEIGGMRTGDPVEIYVDAYPGRVFHGRVQSFQAGSGAAFSLLPPENATGNYVKVVQRVPVKIVFDGDPTAQWLLGPGMSVEPYVRIR
ncbi:MAG: HlyD family secretion protein, partial [Stellaceae bacterium]